MPTISEEQLSKWTQPAFGNEDARRENTEKVSGDSIRGNDFLAKLSIDVYAKGSYKNNTNVRRDSDVDIAVEYTDILMFNYAQGVTQDEVWRARGIDRYSGPLQGNDGSFGIDQFKDAIEEALVSAFGRSAVSRSNKVFTVRESSRSLAADVVPCVTHDHQWSPTSYARGIQLLADKPPRRSVINYPMQHYRNGIEKNTDTSKRFKRIVRILKNLENKMVVDGVCSEVPSYLIESLVFNCPTNCFSGSWAQQVRAVLVHIWEDTKEAECEDRWFEVNNIKFLFHVTQKWTRADARSFVHEAWQYVKGS